MTPSLSNALLGSCVVVESLTRIVDVVVVDDNDEDDDDVEEFESVVELAVTVFVVDDVGIVEIGDVVEIFVVVNGDFVAVNFIVVSVGTGVVTGFDAGAGVVQTRGEH